MIIQFIKILAVSTISLTSGFTLKEETSTLDETPTFTMEEAQKIALNEVNGKIIQQKDDDDDFEFMIEKDDYSYYVEIDKNTKEIDEIKKEKTKTRSSITLEEAQKIALNKVNGEIIKQSQDHDDYEFKIKKDSYIYEIEINKSNGHIDDFDKEKIKNQSSLSKKEARKLALQKVNGKIVKENIDEDEYEFEIQQGKYIYEVKVYMNSKKVVIEDKEYIKADVKISKEQAKQIALKQVNGTIKDVKLDREDCEYSIEITNKQGKYEITINANNGNVLEIEKDD